MKRRLAIGVLALGSAAIVGFLFLPAPPPRIPLPVPNGYDDLIRAGEMVIEPAWRQNRRLEEGTVDELRSYVTENSEAIRIARQGLGRECRIPAHSRHDSALLSKKFGTALRLGALFSAETILASKEGRVSDALRSSLDEVDLALSTTRGGLTWEWIVGLKRQHFGLEDVRKLIQSTEARDCREAIRFLERVKSRREDVGEVISRNSVFIRENYSVLERLSNWHYRFRHGDPSEPLDQVEKFESCFGELVLAELAIQAFRREHGIEPGSLQELMPEYVRSVPLDPFSGRPLIFRRGVGTFLLYSVGPDGRDDGGLQVKLRDLKENKPGDLFPDFCEFSLSLRL